MGTYRTVTPPDEELIKLGKELVEWAEEKTKDLRCTFPEFYCAKKGYIEKEWDLIKRKDVFVPYYEKARIALRKRFIDGTVNPSIAHRFLRIYFPEIRRSEDEETKMKAELSKVKEEERKDELRDLLISIRESEKLSGTQETS